jgi:hypothetical protein
MDLPITPAAHAQEAGDPLVALNRVALRHDARASRHCDGVARRFLERRLSCDLLRVPSVYLRWSSSRRAASHSSRVAVMRFVIAFVSFLRVPSSSVLAETPSASSALELLKLQVCAVSILWPCSTL